MRGILIIACALVACTTGSSGAGTPSGLDTSQCKVGAPNVRFDDPACVATKCSAEASACWGPSWHADRVEGVCRPAVECACKCAKGDVPCLLGCVDKLTPECTKCISAADACDKAKCHPTDSGPSDTGATITVCATLALCCQKLPDGPRKDECETAVSAKDEKRCQDVLDFSRTAGSC